MSDQNGTIFSVKGLKTYFHTEDGVVKAVDDARVTRKHENFRRN